MSVVFAGRGSGSDEPDPAAGARLRALVEGLEVFDPNTTEVVAGPDGMAALDVNPTTTAGIQVDVIAHGSDGLEGHLSYRAPIDVGRTDDVLVVPFRPRQCHPGELPACGKPALPDLVPIISRDQFAPEVRPPSPTPDSVGLLPPETWFIEETDDGRRLLRFSSVSANLGDGPLHILAQVDEALANGSPSAATWQRIWTDTWTFRDIRSGEFVFHPGHNHVHFESFERYRLLTADGDVVAQTGKVSFCLRDSIAITERPRPVGIYATSTVDQCGSHEQAINVGSADHYNQFLPDQWIDITGVDPGDYTVEIIVDPLGLIIETDETNNVGRFDVTIP